MNKELIEKLKNNEEHRIFADMTSDEKKCLKWVSPENCEFLTDNNCRNLEWKSLGIQSEWYPQGIYRIKPDYQSEPEFVDYLIEICEDTCCEEGHFLGVKKKLDNNPNLPHEHTYLYCLSSLPNFKCFWYKSNIGIKSIEFKNIGEVATLIEEEKQTVFARFRS